MINAFEKNKILMPITAIGLIIISIVSLNIIDKLMIPDEWLFDTKLSTLVNTVQNIVCTLVFIIIIKKLFGMKIGIGKNELVKGIFLYGLVICIAVVAQFIGSYQTPQKSYG